MLNGTINNPVTEYALLVGDGSIVAGPWVRLACKRHLDDLVDGMARGVWFNEAASQHAIDFFEQRLRFVEGNRVGESFLLELWQKFIVGSLFGWMGSDGYRRFKTGYIEIGKGNGKTPMAAGMGLYGMVADEVVGAGVYAAASSRDQAMLAFNDARELGLGSTFAGKLQVDNYVIKYPARQVPGEKQSEMKPVSREARSLEGKRVHIGVIDELHVHDSPDVVNSLRDGVKGDPQGLIIEITNSGSDINGICYEHHEFSRQLLEGVYVEDNWFAYIAALDPKTARGPADDYHDPSNWIKANPNIGVSVTVKYLSDQVREADRITSKLNVVKRKNFCIWTDADTAWLSTEDWNALAAPRDREELKGRGKASSFDLSSKIDLTCSAHVFEPYGKYTKPYYTFRFYLPMATYEKTQNRGMLETLRGWVDQGYLILTPGARVDHKQIEKDLLDDMEYYDITDVPHDPWGADAMVQALEKKGFQPIEVRQNYNDLSDPSKEFEAKIVDEDLEHDGNPVMAWCVSNVTKMEDTNGNMKPNKQRSKGRIDGVLAAVMCTAMLEGISFGNVEADGEAVYAEEMARRKRDRMAERVAT